MFNPFMLNTFPELLSYSLLSPFILRVVLGFVFLKFGLHVLSKKEPVVCKSLLGNYHNDSLNKLLGIVHTLAGLLLVVGLYTQIVSIFVFLSSLIFFVNTKSSKLSHQKPVFYVLLMVISISLLFSGAGAFGLDMPL